ncbi:MAG: hypothetical protein ACPGSL_01940 [Vicingaceae bacterium]
MLTVLFSITGFTSKIVAKLSFPFSFKIALKFLILAKNFSGVKASVGLWLRSISVSSIFSLDFVEGFIDIELEKDCFLLLLRTGTPLGFSSLFLGCKREDLFKFSSFTVDGLAAGIS